MAPDARVLAVAKLSKLTESAYESWTLVSSAGRVLAKPKSQILTEQQASTRILPGLISRWMMLAEWRKLREQSKL